MRSGRILKATISVATAALFTIPALAGEMWISNEKDNTLSVIDTDTLEVIATHNVGERPRGILFSADYSKLYICASDSDTVQVMDPNTGEILHELPSGEDPEQFALHPDDIHLYVANEDDAITTIINTQTREVVAQIDVGVEPEGMAVSPDGKIAITTSETTNMAHWIDTEKRAIYANTLVDQRPRHAEFTADGTQLWVSSEIGGTVTIFNTADQAEVAKISFKIKGIQADRLQPVGIRLTKDGARAFVALGPANHVAVINAKTYEVEEYLLTGRRVWHMGMTPDEKFLFTTNGVSGDVTVVDLTSMKPIKSIKVGRFPWGTAYRP